MSKFDHNIVIGNVSHPIKVRGHKDKNNRIYLDSEDLVAQQHDLAVSLLKATDQFDANLFNFAINVSGKRAVELAAMLVISAAHLSQVRHGKKECSGTLWKLFRLVFISLLGRERNRELDQIAISKVSYDAA